MKIKSILVAAVVCTACLEWTRLSGTVKSVDQTQSTITIQNKEGDLLTVPIDYQVTIMEKHDELRSMKTVRLDEKVVLTRIRSDKPKEDYEGMAQPEPSQHGQ